MNDPVDDLISRIDALVDYQMHGGEENAEWRARNHYPVDDAGHCTCPACNRYAIPPAYAERQAAHHLDQYRCWQCQRYLPVTRAIIGLRPGTFGEQAIWCQECLDAWSRSQGR